MSASPVSATPVRVENVEASSLFITPTRKCDEGSGSRLSEARSNSSSSLRYRPRAPLGGHAQTSAKHFLRTPSNLAKLEAAREERIRAGASAIVVEFAAEIERKVMAGTPTEVEASEDDEEAEEMLEEGPEETTDAASNQSFDESGSGNADTSSLPEPLPRVVSVTSSNEELAPEASPDGHAAALLLAPMPPASVAEVAHVNELPGSVPARRFMRTFAMVGVFAAISGVSMFLALGGVRKPGESLASRLASAAASAADAGGEWIRRNRQDDLKRISSHREATAENLRVTLEALQRVRDAWQIGEAQRSRGALVGGPAAPEAAGRSPSAEEVLERGTAEAATLAVAAELFGSMGRLDAAAAMADAAIAALSGAAAATSPPAVAVGEASPSSGAVHVEEDGQDGIAAPEAAENVAADDEEGAQADAEAVGVAESVAADDGEGSQADAEAVEVAESVAADDGEGSQADAQAVEVAENAAADDEEGAQADAEAVEVADNVAADDGEGSQADAQAVEVEQVAAAAVGAVEEAVVIEAASPPPMAAENDAEAAAADSSGPLTEQDVVIKRTDADREADAAVEYEEEADDDADNGDSGTLTGLVASVRALPSDVGMLLYIGFLRAGDAAFESLVFTKTVLRPVSALAELGSLGLSQASLGLSHAVEYLGSWLDWYYYGNTEDG